MGGGIVGMVGEGEVGWWVRWVRGRVPGERVGVGLEEGEEGEEVALGISCGDGDLWV